MVHNDVSVCIALLVAVARTAYTIRHSFWVRVCISELLVVALSARGWRFVPVGDAALCEEIAQALWYVVQIVDVERAVDLKKKS